MGEFLLTFAVEEMLKKVVKLATEQIGLARGLEKELTDLKEWLLKSEAFLHDINTRKFHHRSVKLWVQKLHFLVHEADDLIDRFVYEHLRKKSANEKMKKVRNFISPFVFRSEMAKRIRIITNLLSKHYSEAGPLGLVVVNESIQTEVDFSQLRDTVSELDDFEIVGRDIEVSSIVNKVIDARNQNVTSILPIVGMGGLGKTTLAKLVFNHPRIKQQFDETIWVCVSEPFLINKILRAILESLKETSSSCLDNREVLLRQLKNEMQNKRYFLVLDDVWNENSSLCDELKNCLTTITTESGNSIVVTTRSADVARIMGTLPSHHLSKLSNDNCWSLFIECANANANGLLPMTSSLKLVQEEFFKKIDGIPLVARVLGRAVRFQGDYDRWLTTLESEIRNPFGDGNFVTYVLKLSVDRLPSFPLKQCFAYCSNFPKDFVFEKEQLIRMWIAQGFIHLLDETSDRTMEDVGDIYFEMLLSCCLFQDFDRDDRGRIISCKMHDLVHDIACDVSYSKSLLLDLTNLLEVKRSMIQSKKVASKIRTILWYDWKLGYEWMPHGVEKMIRDNIVNFVCLRVLVMNTEVIYELSDSIDKLIHLRYLDISYCSIGKLPDSIILLYNLQTLRIVDAQLQELPKSLSELVCLRHLEFSKMHVDYIKQMPPYLSGLTQLQTLSMFVVGSEEGCKITELGPLKHLKGSLKLRNLEQVKCKEEAQSAKLVEKKNLLDLAIIWSWDYDRKVNNHNDLEVLEGLQPHKNVQQLQIQSFQGKYFPNMIFAGNLVTVTLLSCRNCERLPTLGQVTSLEELHISHLYGVRSIGSEFYGNNSNKRIFFPMLKKLIIDRLDYLEQWEEVRATSNVTTFPRLQQLKVRNCPMLSDIPNLFGFCDENGVKHLRIVEISECSKLTKLPEGLQSCHSIQELNIEQCCSYLVLNVENRNMWSSLSITIPDKLVHLTNLKQLKVLGCMEHHGPLNLCSSKRIWLGVSSVYNMEHLSIQQSIDALLGWLGNLTSLQTLSLSFCLNFGD